MTTHNTHSSFSIQTKTPLALFAKYGFNSHSFLALYKGYSYFYSTRGIEGTVPFIETTSAWVGAADPLCSKEVMPYLLLEFKKAAESAGKTAVFLPVTKDSATLALRAGYQILKIGTEPVFDLQALDPNPHLLTTSHRLHMKGAVVFELHPRAMPTHLKQSLDLVVEEWLRSRKMGTLHFLNRVEPWTLSEHKKYFCLEYEGGISAFVGAVPIPQKGGWYLVDIFRKPTAAIGSVELLLLEAMRILKRQGATFVSLGFAPLSGLEETKDAKVPLISKILNLVYHHGNYFYNFKSLDCFKRKIGPTQIEDNYLCYSSPALGLSTVKAIGEVSLGGSTLEIVGAAIAKKLRWSNVRLTLSESLSRTVVFKNEIIPKSLLIRNVRASFSLSLLFIFCYFFFHGSISSPIPDQLTRYAFSLEALDTLNFKSLVVSPFLQRDFTELVSGVGFFFLTSMILESLASSLYVGLAFIMGALVSPLFASVFIFLPIKKFMPSLWDQTYFSLIIGSTLCTLSTIGAVLRFLAKGRLILILSCSLLTAVGILTKSGRFFFDITALALGFATSGFLLKSYGTFYRGSGIEKTNFTFGAHGASLPYRNRKER